MTGMLPLTARPAWKALEAQHEKIRDLHLRELFADDATRGERLTAEAVGIYLDYSKNRVTDETAALLCRLAEESGLRERIDAMFRGDKINQTENRPSCMSRCRPRAARRSSWTARTECPTSTPYSARWLTSPTQCGA